MTAKAMPFDSLLIANRGEVALRIARTARRLGLRTIAVASDADRDGAHARACDEAVAIGGELPADSYLRIDKLLAAARTSGARAVHPGYGFLAENAAFAQAVLDAGLVWIGPPPAAMAAMGDKAAARRHAAALGVPVVPGHDGDEQSDAGLADAAARIGYPLLVKARAGGGGRGMRLVDSHAGLPAALHAARREAEAAFGDARLILERAVARPRHVEFQVFGDTHGEVIHLGERDCSVQRRHQKLVEEAPCPALTPALRREMGERAVTLARAIGYVGAGTVEMLLQPEAGAFFFMEMNTRLQVEHPVTEALLGIDLVEWQLRIAAGEPLPLTQDAALERHEAGGHAIEVRLCAEDARHDDLPQGGLLAVWRAPAGVRCDHALASGQLIAPWYDSMLAKLVAHAPTRDAARRRLAHALDDTLALGVATNRALLAAVLRHPAFAAADVATDFLARHFADRSASLPPARGEQLALAALWLASHGAAALPAAWAASALAGPRETTVPIGIGDAIQHWRVVRERDGARVEGPDGPHRFGMPRWSCEGALLTLAAELHGDGLARTLRLEALRLHDAAGDRLVGLCGGVDIELLDLRLAAPPHRRDAAGGDVLAPMHGRLLQLHVAIGDVVERGQTLAVLEAMKMEHALAAPLAGRVRALHAAPGAQVGAAQLLVEIEEMP
jgi:geranyl-CoA carboxylase alpha subunit